MILEHMMSVVDQGNLPIDVAEKYLNIYIGEADWKTHIAKLWTNFENKNKNKDLSREEIKKTVSCAALLPTVEKTNIPDPVHLILFWCPTWNQYREKDWFSLFKNVVKKDIEIQKNHKQLISLGVIDPIDYSPITRQAYNWLYSHAKNSGAVNDKNEEIISKKMQNLIRIYGGAVISNLFTNHTNSVDKVFNWKSGYFFEREIYNVYTFDQIKKIKSKEIEKLNPKFVKILAIN